MDHSLTSNDRLDTLITYALACSKPWIGVEVVGALRELKAIRVENAELTRCLDGGVNCAREKIELRAKLADYAHETKSDPLVLNGHQLRQALEFLDNENDTNLCFRLYTEDRHEPGKHGEPMPKGMYCWFFEYPEEGQLLLAEQPSEVKASAPDGCEDCGGSGRLTIYDNGGFGQLRSPIGDEPCPKCDPQENGSSNAEGK